MIVRATPIDVLSTASTIVLRSQRRTRTPVATFVLDRPIVALLHFDGDSPSASTSLAWCLDHVGNVP